MTPWLWLFLAVAAALLATAAQQFVQADATSWRGLIQALALMTEDYVLFWGILIGSLAAWLLPCLIAWAVARLHRLPKSAKFAVASAVLTYGISVLLMLVLAPLSLAADHLSPEWAANGYVTLGNGVARVAEYAGYAVLLVPLALMFVVPYRLKRLWPGIVGLMSANNPFKPKPLRGSA